MVADWGGLLWGVRGLELEETMSKKKNATTTSPRNGQLVNAHSPKKKRREERDPKKSDWKSIVLPMKKKRPTHGPPNLKKTGGGKNGRSKKVVDGRVLSQAPL